MNIVIKHGLVVLSLIVSAGQMAHADGYAATGQPVVMDKQQTSERLDRQDDDRVFAGRSQPGVASPDADTTVRPDRLPVGIQGGNAFNWMAGGGG